MKYLIVALLSLMSFSSFAQHAEIQCENLKDGTIIFLNVQSRTKVSLSNNFFGLKGIKDSIDFVIDEDASSKTRDVYRYEDALKLEIDKFKIKGEGFTFKELKADFEVSKDGKETVVKKYKCLFYE